MNTAELRSRLADRSSIGANAFVLLHELACVVGDPERREAGHDLVLRALEYAEDFQPYTDVLYGLVRAIGLFPYLSEAELGLSDRIAYEYHRPEGGTSDLVLHRQQADIYRRLLEGDSVILSAPTSFGKSRIVDALIGTGHFSNLAIIVPTLALIDETRRRLSQFADRFKVITHPTQASAERNIFVLTAERAVARTEFPPLDLLVIDEFYKLGELERDLQRTVLLNQAFYRLRKLSRQFYLLGPNIAEVPVGIEAAFKCVFYPTRYTTVASNQVLVARSNDEMADLVGLCTGLKDPTLIFCKSPARANKVARALSESMSSMGDQGLEDASSWVKRNFHPEWVVAGALERGIGVHHGRVPRALAQFMVRAFNSGQLRFLVCTSTLIEGVNTKAKNVVVFDNAIARRQLDFFTFSNIKGRSGRMFQHFVGNVFLFDEPPAEQLPFVDFPLFTQRSSTPESLLIQLDAADLRPEARKRVQRFAAHEVLPLEVLQANGGFEPENQIELAREIELDPWGWSGRLAWTRVPTTEQLRDACELAWQFLAPSAGGGTVRSGRQLAFKIWELRREGSVYERAAAELLPGQFAAKTPDEAVERVLDFDRRWACFEFPRMLMALSRIQRSVLGRHGAPCGDYSLFATQVECLFTTPVILALEEYGVPMVVGRRLQSKLRAHDDLDAALEELRLVDLSQFSLDQFEQLIVEDAVEHLPGERSAGP